MGVRDVMDKGQNAGFYLQKCNFFVMSERHFTGDSIVTMPYWGYRNSIVQALAILLLGASQYYYQLIT